MLKMDKQDSDGALVERVTLLELCRVEFLRLVEELLRVVEDLLP